MCIFALFFFNYSCLIAKYFILIMYKCYVKCGVLATIKNLVEYLCFWPVLSQCKRGLIVQTRAGKIKKIIKRQCLYFQGSKWNMISRSLTNVVVMQVSLWMLLLRLARCKVSTVVYYNPYFIPRKQFRKVKKLQSLSSIVTYLFYVKALDDVVQLFELPKRCVFQQH